MSYGDDEYQELVRRFGDLVRTSVPEQATVLVVSKGDRGLLDIEKCSTWHFPQRADGTYAGYHPHDSASAIAHLEALREKGGDYLAIPAPSLWWLEHYRDLREHLESRYSTVTADEKAGLIYALDPRAGNGAERPSTGTAVEAPKKPPVRNGSPDTAMSKLLSLEHYASQTGRTFASTEEALVHYDEIGQHEGADPHPLFHTRWYAREHPESQAPGRNPLLHFCEHVAGETPDPNPYFDTEYYYGQVPRLHQNGVNALVHYVDPDSRAAHPNPLFRDGYYRNNMRNAPTSAPTPLEHFLRYGNGEGRATSHVHEKLLTGMRGDSGALHRGGWTRGNVLWFTKGSPGGPWPAAISQADHLAAVHHTGGLVITFVAEGHETTGARTTKPFVLEDYALACDIFRPSALRLLALALTSPRPLFAVCDVPDVLETLASNGVDCYFPFPDDARSLTADELDRIALHSRRVLVSSKKRRSAVAKRLKPRSAKVTVCAPPKKSRSADRYADALLRQARKDLDLSAPRPAGRPKPTTRPKLLIPCSDWAVSGVNASMESIGLQLLELGWDIELIFTRDEETVQESADGKALPALPHRFLERDRKGPTGVWRALIGEVESQAPCILFMAYDFVANSVAPALTDDVGVVTWVQADDRDYYEQVYRLGPYCNAVICVSEMIREQVAGLNPVIGERSHVIHNSSVREREIVKRRSPHDDRMRLVYTGRLVQYQKRILDFVDLAEALDRTEVPYEITLIGTFSAHDGVGDEFERRAAAHLDDGRIRLPGRMPRGEIMQALKQQDFFVLLSDFEGLPLSLVEAMARGCVPVVADSPSGIPEIIASGENGYIVEGRDYDEWAALLTGLWKDPSATSETSRLARGTVLEKFTVERVGAQFDELLRGVAAEIGSGGYERPRSLNWGGERSHAGDVLPSPNLFRPAGLQLPGMG